MPRPKLPDKEFDWTPQLAYAVGLLVTDGNLSRDGQHIVMRSVDKQLLCTFRDCLGLPNKIAQAVDHYRTDFARKPAYRIQFGGARFYRWLMKIGLMPNKSKVIGEVAIPDEYFRDFLRGHLDGDGSVTTYIDSYNTFKNPKYIYTRLWVRFISASKPHIDWLQSNTARLCGVKGHRAQTKVYGEHRTSISVLKFGKKDSLRLLRWMYYKKDLPCLERKRVIAEQFILPTS